MEDNLSQMSSYVILESFFLWNFEVAKLTYTLNLSLHDMKISQIELFPETHMWNRTTIEHFCLRLWMIAYQIIL